VIPTRYRNPSEETDDTAVMKVLALGCVLFLAACSTAPVAQPEPPQQPPGQPIVITSADLGDPPVLATGTTEGAPQRIVSLANGIGETLVALGATERVVGRDETSDIPALQGVPVVTQAHSLAAERVLQLTPDLVLIDENTNPPEAIDQLRASGVRVVQVPMAWTVADIPARTAAVADAIGATGLTDFAITTESTTGSKPRVAFLYLRGPSAIYLLGGEQSGADALIAAAGGVDVGAEAGLAAFTPLTSEALIAADPEVLLVMTKGLESVNGVDGLLALPGVQQTTAARNRAVIAVDDGVLLSFGPRTGTLIEKLQSALASLG
jgi:iron complex transport system substrate-binding protein